MSETARRASSVMFSFAAPLTCLWIRVVYTENVKGGSFFDLKRLMDEGIREMRCGSSICACCIVGA